MVLFVLESIFVLFEPYVHVRFHSLSSGNLVAPYWVIASHLAYDIFSNYKYVIVKYVFPPRFLEWKFLSD